MSSPVFSFFGATPVVPPNTTRYFHSQLLQGDDRGWTCWIPPLGDYLGQIYLTYTLHPHSPGPPLITRLTLDYGEMRTTETDWRWLEAMDQIRPETIRVGNHVWQPLHLSHDYSSRWLPQDQPIKLSLETDSNYTHVQLQLSEELTRPDPLTGVYDPINLTLQYSRPTASSHLDYRYPGSTILSQTETRSPMVGSPRLLIEYLRSEIPLPIRLPGVISRSISNPLRSLVETITFSPTRNWQGFWWILTGPDQFKTVTLRVGSQVLAKGDSRFWRSLSSLSGYNSVPLYYWCHLGRSEASHQLTLERSTSQTAYLIVYSFALE